MSQYLYELQDISFDYQLGQQHVHALDGINYRIKESELLLLMGPSGSGKSTLLNLLGLIESLQHGEIRFGGHSFAGLSEAQKNHIRRYEVGFIFQSFLLFDVLTVAENIEYFLIKQKIDRSERRKRIAKVLDQVGLAHKAHQRPTQLSGGQRQRVAIARALAKHPRVIIADEPTANLDQATAADILTIMRSMAGEGCTIIMASHDQLAKSYATHCLNLKDGRLEQKGGGDGFSQDGNS